jgi:hypothetical protein
MQCVPHPRHHGFPARLEVEIQTRVREQVIRFGVHQQPRSKGEAALYHGVWTSQ